MPSKPNPKPTPKNDGKGKKVIAPLPMLKDDLKKLKKAPPVMKKGTNTKKFGRGM
jgi:hypothetical protein